MAIRALRHVGLKMVSIGLAALLWLIVSGEQIVERSLRDSAGVHESAGTARGGRRCRRDVVEVRVRGSSGALSRIAAGELVAVMDLRGSTPGPAAVSSGEPRCPRAVRHRRRAGGALEHLNAVRAVGHQARADRAGGRGRTGARIRGGDNRPRSRRRSKWSVRPVH